MADYLIHNTQPAEPCWKGHPHVDEADVTVDGGEPRHNVKVGELLDAQAKGNTLRVGPESELTVRLVPCECGGGYRLEPSTSNTTS